MGPKESSLNNSDYAQLLAEFDVIQKIEHENCSLLRKKSNGEEYFLKQFTFNDQKEYQKQLELLRKRKHQLAGCKYLLKVDRIVSLSQDQYCSSFFKIYALMEWDSRSLDDEVNQRNLQKRRFQQKDLWSIAGSCIIAFSYMQKQSIKHQALSSQNIILTSEGVIKLYDPSLTNRQSNYEAIKRGISHIYLSPEETDALQRQQSFPNNHPYKSDIWTLGMIILEIGLGQYQDECYRDEFSRIHWETLQFNLKRFKQIFSEELSLLVEFMLSKQEKMRPDWYELEDRLIDQDGNRNSSLRSSSQRPSSNYKLYQQLPNNHIQLAPQQKGEISFTKSQTYPLEYDTHAMTFKPNQLKLNPIQQALVYPQNPNASIKGNIAKIVKPSFINNTRPSRSIFPAPIYVASTNIDENLVPVLSDTSDILTSKKDTLSNFDSSLKPQQINLGKQNNFYHTFTPIQMNLQQKDKQSAKVNVFETYSGKTFKTNAPLLVSKEVIEQGEYVVERYRQGSQYQGYKLNGMRHGDGVFYYQDGGKYEGQWNYNRMEGKGCLFYQSGRLAYDGQWLNDQFDGKGTLYNEQPQILNQPYEYRDLDNIDDFWIKYQGDFKEDLKNGKGILYLSNGEKYQGVFKNDFTDGVGCFYRQDGSNVQGRWINNKLID